MADVFHLGLTRDQLRGASIAILPGDPGRVERIASEFDNPEFMASAREFTSWRGTLGDKPIVACSTGIGGPSTSIAVEELAQLGVRTFLRVGTTGAIQPDIEPGALIVSSASVRLDGASHHFAPAVYPAVADFGCTRALVDSAEAMGATYRVGITASADTFYPGQERYDTVSGRVAKHLQGSVDEWATLGVLNFEMESATLFTMCATQGWRAGCIAGAIVNRMQQEIPDESVIAKTEADAITAVVGAARLLLDAEEASE